MPNIGTISHQGKQYAAGPLYRSLSAKMWLGLQSKHLMNDGFAPVW
jgi:hypothetical protein